MAQEIIIAVWCDACAADGKRTEGEPREMALGEGVARRRLDLCDSHVSELFDPLYALWSDHSTALDSATARPTSRPSQSHLPVKPRRPRGRNSTLPQSFPCLLCSYTCASRTGVRAHYVTHGVLSLVTLLGSTCPLCLDVSRSGVQLVDHVIAEHDLPTVDLAMQTAEQQGDPHSIVKSVRESMLRSANGV